MNYLDIKRIINELTLRRMPTMDISQDSALKIQTLNRIHPQFHQ